MDKVFLTGLLMVFLLGLPGLAGAVTFSDRLPTGDSSNDPLQKIAVTLSDPDGINKDKVYFEVDGFNYALNDPRMSYNEATGRLEYTPIRERDELDKVDVLVSAEDTLGEKGELRFSFTINSIGPAPIDFLSFEAGVLRWAKPLSLDSVAKYKVYRDTSRIKDNGKSAYFLAEATGLNYTDSTREEGKRYFYAVTAVDNPCPCRSRFTRHPLHSLRRCHTPASKDSTLTPCRAPASRSRAAWTSLRREKSSNSSAAAFQRPTSRSPTVCPWKSRSASR